MQPHERGSLRQHSGVEAEGRRLGLDHRSSGTGRKQRWPLDIARERHDTTARPFGLRCQTNHRIAHNAAIVRPTGSVVAVEVRDLRRLIALESSSLLDDASILHASEPLVLVPTGDESERDLAAIAAVASVAPTVTVLVDETGRLADRRRFDRLAKATDISLTTAPDPPSPWIHDELKSITEPVAAHPLAAFSLATLLRSSFVRPVWEGLAAEATSYSMLLGAQDFRGWLQRRGPATVKDHVGRGVVIRKHGPILQLKLNRAEARNAIDSSMRDLLVDAFRNARIDPSVARITLTGNGPSFCAGGDLAEFGTAPSGATAMAARLTRHPGWEAHQVADILTVHLHGHCVGAGIEIAAFARQVEAAADTVIQLPELSLGLIPGAGGTVSIPRRIGRQRTMWLALTQTRLTATEALHLGLIDRIVD